MKSLLAAVVLLLAAGSAGAAQIETALAEDNLLWSVDGAADSSSLVLTLRVGETQQTVLVPTTDDEAIDAQPRLAWDATSRTLLVAWRRLGVNGDEIRLTRRYASGRWSPPIVIAEGENAQRAGLQFVVTHAADEAATFVHLAWWTLRERPVAQYGLAAFRGPELLSTSVDLLDDLAAVLLSVTPDEDTGNALHPPLAMVPNGSGVDVAYGAPRTTGLTLLQIEPRKVTSEARIWRPSGKHGRRTPAAQFLSSSTAPVESFISGGNIVLYTPDSRFRYVIFEDGKWTPVRTLATDEKVTSHDLVRELRRSVGQQGAAPASADSK